MKSVVVLLAPGFEGIELGWWRTRSGGWAVVPARGKRPITGWHDIRARLDTGLETIRAEEFHMVVLPGCIRGTTHLRRARFPAARNFGA